MMCDNLTCLLSCNTNKEYWDMLREWTDDRPVKPAVTSSQLHKSFKARLNPPDELPDHFDADLHDIISSLTDTIPQCTQDRTPEQFFTRRIAEDDIKRIKVKLRKKSYRSAQGIEAVSYSKIMTIPNDVLVELFHTCLDKCDAPQ
ncbi:hypothetical protein DFH09DRAFT_1340300 [Mycena vulgaris]|nr:hypothetical protein DFH09DRAFT_1340300 [Mycena vulgaris]